MEEGMRLVGGDGSGDCRKTFKNRSRNSKHRYRRQQTLAAFWEHLPPIDPALVAAAMQRIRDRISALEDRKRAILQEDKYLIVHDLTRNRRERVRRPKVVCLHFSLVVFNASVVHFVMFSYLARLSMCV
ncbi:hypothetical protein RND81_05G019600 [Saponaria officinalis]|uniref:Uncharacterized protein n=1 Tax=Saponaria officinalis TaxID=3572 RepID=A0AAW1KWK1_SAPOF